MKTKKQISFLPKGLILAFSLMMLLSSITTYADFHTPALETETSQSSDEEGENKDAKDAVLTAFEAVIIAAHFEIHFESYLIQELQLISETSIAFCLYKVPAYSSRHFKTLFRLIVGPNAP